jgi:hypothetical protein
MKKLLIILLMTIFFVNSYGQQRSMGSDGILGKLQIIIDAAENRDMEVVRIEADIIRTTKEIHRTLDPSFTYSIIAVGSNRIEDLDIEIYKKINGSWTLIKKDADSKSVAVVEIKPSSSEEYGIVVKAYKFYSGYNVGHYGLVISHD